MARTPLTGWPVVILVSLGAAVAQAFGRFTYGVLLPAIRDDLGHSNSVAGFLGTVNVSAYLIGTFAVASLTSRLKLMTVMRCGLICSFSGLLLAVASPNIAVLAIALAIMGLGGAFIWIPSPAIAAAAVGEHRRGLAVGLSGVGIGTGIIFAGQLARVLRERNGDGAWRQVYGVEAGIGAIVIVAILLFLRHRESAPSGARSGTGLSTLRTMPGWIALTASYAFFGFSYLLAFSFLTSRLEDDAGFSESRASTMFTLVGVGAVLGGVVLGLVADRFGERPTIIGGFSVFALAVAAIMTGSLPFVIAGSLIFGVVFSGLASVIAGYVVRNTSATTFGPSFAATTLAFGLAQVASPQVGGIIADVTGSFTVVYVLAIGFALGGVAASSQLPRVTSPASK